MNFNFIDLINALHKQLYGKQSHTGQLCLFYFFFLNVNQHIVQTVCLDYNLKEKFVLVPVDKAANNVSFICKRFYAQVLLKEMGFLGNPNPTYTIFHRKGIPNIIKTKEREIKTCYFIESKRVCLMITKSL